MSDLYIESDFTDFYDTISKEKSPIKYRRYISECKQRGTALKYLRSIGLSTIDIKPVNQYLDSDGLLVVYTDPKQHSGQGKKLLTVEEAKVMYNNCIASNYYKTENNLTIKYVQIGKRRFTLYFKKNENSNPLSMGDLINIQETQSEYNRLVGLPIFSIDYISVGDKMLATDFNEVQSLESLGMYNYIQKEDVIKEIIDSLITYNKIKGDN